MANNEWIDVACIEVTQPIGSFYIAAIGSRELEEISYADRRRIEQGERDIEIISGIQRPLSPQRVKELKKYVKNVDAAFPTGIILAIDSDNADYDKEKSVMRIRRAAHVAKIIDGQHRIEGLIGYQGPTFQLNVTIFIDMDMEDQAHVFATINLKQTPVNKSLAYDLFEYAETRSPQKTSHNVARLLNSKSKSPFEHKIMILGTANRASETLTQAAFIEPLLKLISRDPMSDRDSLRRGKDLTALEPAEVRATRLIFRNMFVEDRDEEIAKALWNYFAAVEERWPEAWGEKQAGLILNRTTGYRALMRFLPLAYLTVGIDVVIQKAEFRAMFNLVKINDVDFTPDNYKPGTSGQSELYHQLVRYTGVSESSPWTGKRRD
jgi:DGQHR domain-containing protein